jgi:riboflavin synthase
MFTGIIQNQGTVKTLEKNSGKDLRVIIETDMDLAKTPIGASICCSGVCLTVVDKGSDYFAVDVSEETLSKSELSLWKTGMHINLEPSLKLGDELGGHFVFGHTDGQAKVESVKQAGDSHVVTLSVPGALTGFIAPKGSVTLDGVSLTVNDVRGSTFTVNIIPHTWEITTLGRIKAGDKLNIEIDMLARYVARALSGQQRNVA